MRVVFVGAGPGDPGLLTLRGRRVIETADLVLYAGSLVNSELLDWRRPGTPVMDTAGMDLRQITEVFAAHKESDGLIARLHTGDPSLYGATQEQIAFCRREAIPFEVIPGVSSFSAAAAALESELTRPGATQTVILTRMAGRTPVPENERLSSLAAHGSSLVLFLSVHMIRDAVRELAAGYAQSTPVAVVARASWPDQKIVRGTLQDIAERVEVEGIRRQALILVGEALGADVEGAASCLYDRSFGHGFREAGS